LAKKLRVGVIFGGRSGEHEVSLRSAGSVVQAIDTTRYEIIPIAIAKEGKWLSPPDAAVLLPAAAQAKLSNKILPSTRRDVAILGDPSHSGLITLNNNSRESSEPLDLIFPVLHGTYGEDGTIQGLLDMANVPYVGCGVLASACGMDKVAMKSLFQNAELPICKYIWFLRSEWQKDPDSILRRTKQKLGYPCFVKPANLGSSVGVSKATDKKSLAQAIDLAARFDRKIIVEENINGREIEKPQVHGLLELQPADTLHGRRRLLEQLLRLSLRHLDLRARPRGSSSRAGRSAIVRSSEARYAVRSPRRSNGIHTVLPVCARSPQNSERLSSSQNER